MRSVVDTSTLARLFLEDHGHESVRSWFTAAIDEGVELHAPELALYELGRVIEREADDLAIDERDTLLQLLLEPVQLSRAPPIVTFDHASAHRLTFFDASFLALAVEMGAELVTSDRALARAAEAAGVRARAFA